jgi:hypothetical protein
MKARIRAVWLMLLGGFIGFALGRYTSEKPSDNTLKAVAVEQMIGTTASNARPVEPQPART